MKTLRLASILAPTFALVLVAACDKGGSATENPDEAAAQPAPAGHDEGEAQEGEAHEGEAHEHHFEGAVAAYHDVLSPLWHAEPGDERTENTCAGTDELIANAQAVTTDATPAAASSEDNWKARGADLVAASENLAASCQGDRADFEASFEKVHDAFHGLIEEIGEGH